jgi:LmbE family N-acetylglucosaminyl deacetylase
LDGAFHKSLGMAFAALKRAVDTLGPIERFVTTAYEGGHMDHDCCAALTLELARATNTPVEQFALYNSRGLPHPLFRAAAPIAENGPVRQVPVGLGQFLKWMACVRFFPSQAKTWLGLTPTAVWSVAVRGFGVQQLAPRRILERPHAGALLYEQRFGVTYAEVRTAQDDLLSRLRTTGSGPA